MADPLNGRGFEDQRGAPRVAVLLRTAKLISRAGEFMCILRDVSQTGVSVQVFHRLPNGVELTLELSNGDRHALERVWEKDGRAGFRFRDPGHLESIVACRSAYPRRAPRLMIPTRCEIVCEGHPTRAHLGNISQHGAMIRTTARFALMQRLSIGVGGLPPVEAAVRWRIHDRHGLCFQRSFGLEELARIAFELQCGEGERPSRRRRLTGI